ncbi:MAG: DNA methyltransferase [Patescibacteria group bacterium]
MPAHQYQPVQPAQSANKSRDCAYWFVLGRESLIAAAELHAVLNLSEYKFAPPILQAVLNKFDAKKLITEFGGTIKIAEEIGGGLSEEQMADLIARELETVEGKINFGLSFYSQGEKSEQMSWVKKFGLNIKKKLKAEGYSVRYVENREPVLSSVTVDKNGLTERGREFLITTGTSGARQFTVAKTLAVQPFEEFSFRDFGRPGRDDLSGMLPPKLAMMMINLAQCPKDGVLLDPFCGSGTILTEAMLLEYENLIGADNSEKAISDTQKNIEWIKDKFEVGASKVEIFQNDIKNLSKKVKGGVSAIVTEPFLGNPLKGYETQSQLVVQMAELKELYLASFKEFYKILKPGGVVVFIIPCFRYKNEWLKINCENEIKKIGFATEKLFENHTSLLYARPDQKIGREIWRFRR